MSAARSWLASAWWNLPRIQASHPELTTLDAALDHRIVGPVVRAHAAQLQDADARAKHARGPAPVQLPLLA